VSSEDRVAYLEQMCKLLWPAPAEVEFTSSRAVSLRQAGDTSADVTTLLVLPRLSNPRLLVPRERRAGSSALRRYGEPGSVRSSLATRALSVGLARGAGGILAPDRLQVRVPPGAQTIDSHICSLLGHKVLVSMHIGGARANRKPVLQLLTPAGRTVGFAKVGHNPLTAALVRAENDALRRLGTAGLSHLRVPRVLGFSRWQGLDVLVLSPLPAWQRRTPLRPGRLAKAMAEVAGVSGILQSQLGHSQYLQNLTARLDKADADVSCEGRARDVSAERDDLAALRAALAELAAAAGTTVLAFGSWHGDWTPWNMASTEAGLLVWDWERFTAGVPAGFDALHCWLQEHVVPGRRDPARAAAECLERAPALLEPLGVTPAQASVTALLYLADLSVRYLADRQELAGARLGAPRRWLLPTLATGIGALHSTGSLSHEPG
jgi:hypothetical protein